MKFSTLIIFLSIVFSTNAITKQDFLENKELNKFFNKAELLEISRMVDFIDSVVVYKTNENEISIAYHKYFDSWYQCLDSCESGIDPDDVYKFISNLNQGLVEKIWIMETFVREVRTKDTILYDVDNFPSKGLNPTGNYLKYMKQIGRKDQYFKEISESIRMSGDLSPSMFAGFLYYNQRFDFNKIEYRLWASIFILTIEESVENKVERYIRK
jgi:hypothetical protein